MPINKLKKGSHFVVRKPRLSNQIYELIRSDLRSGHYAPDIRFTEPGIAETLNISRTPVREALFQLVNNGLLTEFERGYGLPRLSKQDVAQMMDIRIALETLIVKNLCKGLSAASMKKLRGALEKEKTAANKEGQESFIEANNALRTLLYELTADPYLKESAELYADRLQIFRVLTLSSKENRQFVSGMHEKLVEAIAEQDEKKAVASHVKMLKQAGKAYADAAVE